MGHFKRIGNNEMGGEIKLSCKAFIPRLEGSKARRLKGSKARRLEGSKAEPKDESNGSEKNLAVIVGQECFVTEFLRSATPWIDSQTFSISP